MRIERNISYLNGRRLPYQIRVKRNDLYINESYATYEEAVKARDEIEANYRKTGKIEHSSIYENGRFKLAKSRYNSDDLKRSTKSGRPVYAIDVTCKQCHKDLTYRWCKHYQQFLSRDQICQSCFVKNRYNELLDIRNSNDEPNRNNHLTGVKNVTFNKKLSKYRVVINRDNRRFNLHTNTLNEAIALKERVLDFYEKFDRLPTPDEV